MKCPLIDKKNAICGDKNQGPTFGAGHDISVMYPLEQSFCNPTSYKDSNKIIDSENYSGGLIYFWPLEMEVYRV